MNRVQLIDAVDGKYCTHWNRSVIRVLLSLVRILQNLNIHY